MADEAEAWPDYNEVATKGDIIGALVEVHSLATSVFIALSASQRGDKARLDAEIRDIENSVKDIGKLIDRLGGNDDG